MRVAALLVAALFLGAVSSDCAAEPFAVRLGDARIGLDAPPGFADTVFTGSPRLRELAEALTSASNRILLFAISDSDLRRFEAGDPPQLRRYMLVATPRASERGEMSLDEFDAMVEKGLRDLGPGATRLRRDTSLASVLQESSAGGQRLLSTTTLMLLRGKPLTVSVYTLYGGPTDAEWIRSTTERWIDELRRLNSR